MGSILDKEYALVLLRDPNRFKQGSRFWLYKYNHDSPQGEDSFAYFSIHEQPPHMELQRSPHIFNSVLLFDFDALTKEGVQYLNLQRKKWWQFWKRRAEDVSAHINITGAEDGSLSVKPMPGIRSPVTPNAHVDYDEMVYVPAGSFKMGSNDGESDEKPVHTVHLKAYYIDKHPVTNAQYKRFCDATDRSYPDDPGFSGMDNYFTSAAYVNYPVVNVSWDEARAYASWAEKRLPTEAEWERAAKGDKDNREWPWGDTWVGANANIWDNPADGYTYTSPVGTYPNGVSPAGCYDMAGNVWEWCEDDWHESYTGAPSNGSAWIDNPRGSRRIGRSGSWGSGSTGTRCAYRGGTAPAIRRFVIGFRCARTP
jgi:formylglycine-generating enzyme required for sulfatase activity